MTLAKLESTAKTPSHLWIDSKSSTVYSTMQDSDELVAIDLARQAIKWRVKTGPMPADVLGTADDTFLLVALTGGDAVEVYDVSGKTPARSKSSRRRPALMRSAPLATSAICWSATAWPTPSAKSTCRPLPSSTTTRRPTGPTAWMSARTASRFW